MVRVDGLRRIDFLPLPRRIRIDFHLQNAKSEKSRTNVIILRVIRLQVDTATPSHVISPFPTVSTATQRTP